MVQREPETRPAREALIVDARTISHTKSNKLSAMTAMPPITP